ncbi:MAG: hypothetical protein KY475_18115 [Planctomycetes bacterium]|nr:hypothetical protein [Planctomycetota bacterium]
MATHAYPPDFASFVAERWEEATRDTDDDSAISPDVRQSLPEPKELEYVISTCYQASLLRDEERPVTFRAIICPPGLLPAEHGPPTGLHRLAFTRPRPLNEDELRRLSPSVDFYRSLIGVWFGTDGKPEIWGIISSGPRWVKAAQGDRISSPPLPDRLVVCATGPGRIVAARGLVTLATLHGGRIICPASDVLESRWLQDTFASVREEIIALHRDRAARDAAPRRPIDPQLIGRISRHVVRRIISIIRSSRHGATLLFLPPETAERREHQTYINIKYHFTDDEPRRRFRALMLEIVDELAYRDGAGRLEDPVGWEEYMGSRNERLAELDEAIAELTQLLASVSAADGAVVLTRRFEILGFGSEISGELPDVPEVDRSLDADARERSRERTAGVGTRHRSVYRLCQRMPEVLAIIISQDGGVRFVKQLDGRVAYWDHVSIGVRDV